MVKISEIRERELFRECLDCHSTKYFQNCLSWLQQYNMQQLCMIQSVRNALGDVNKTAERCFAP